MAAAPAPAPAPCARASASSRACARGGHVCSHSFPRAHWPEPAHAPAPAPAPPSLQPLQRDASALVSSAQPDRHPIVADRGAGAALRQWAHEAEPPVWCAGFGHGRMVLAAACRRAALSAFVRSAAAAIAAR